MADEPLHLTQPHRVTRHLGRLERVVHAHPRAHAQERQHRQPSRGARRAARREGVVGPGPIVSEHLGGAAAYEESSVVLQSLAECGRVGDVQLNVLNRETIRDLGRLAQIAHHHRVTAASQGQERGANERARGRGRGDGVWDAHGGCEASAAPGG